MAKLSGFDEQVAHTYFSVHCFNEAWVYLKGVVRLTLSHHEADLRCFGVSNREKIRRITPSFSILECLTF
jgi:hypothetical protein